MANERGVSPRSSSLHFPLDRDFCIRPLPFPLFRESIPLIAKLGFGGVMDKLANFPTDENVFGRPCVSWVNHFNLHCADQRMWKCDRGITVRIRDKGNLSTTSSSISK